MSTIQNLFQQAQLAEAAYVDFSTGLGTKEALVAKGFSDAQASDFVTHWRVVDQYTASGLFGLTDGTGFSATVFESVDNPGQYSLAMRGTAGLTDLSADAGDVLTDGLALDQIVDMYNYWQSLHHDLGYTAYKLETQLAETVQLTTLWAQVAIPGASIYAKGVYDAYRAELQTAGLIVDIGPLGPSVRKLISGDSVVLLTGTPLAAGSGKLIGVNTVDASGHSLGGHLAMAFSRLFPTTTGDVVAVNGAGFDLNNGNVNTLFSQLNGAAGFDAGKITNVVGSAAMNLVSQDWLFLQQPAGRSEIYTESYLPGSGTTLGHGSSQMTDSLAVYNLLATLDPSLNTNPAGLTKIGDILRASSNTADRSLETTLDALGKVFGQTFATATNDRESYYTNLNQMQALLGSAFPASYTVVNLANMDAATLVASAVDQANLAYRYALKELNAFAVVGADYSSFNQNGELTLYNPATRTGTLTDQYLKDRSAFIVDKNLSNTQDNLSNGMGYVGYAGTKQYFRDESGTTPTTVVLGGGLLANQLIAQPPDDIQQIRFGSDTIIDTLQGGSKADHLYGMGGDDTLQGNGGNDYLEGNAGNDDLTGGVGNDTLLGGAGNDTYHVGEGLDTILDSDGQGSIYLGADLLNGGVSKDDGYIWQSSDGKHTYAFTSGDPNAAEGATLVVDDKLAVQHYHTGDLGLTLDGAAIAPPTTNQTFMGDSGANWVTALDGDNLFVGNGTATSSATSITGIMGDIFIAGNGNNRIYADTQVDIETALAQQEILTASGQPGDFIAVGAVSNPPYADGGVTGGQQIYSFPVGSGNNTIVGGTGNDLIIAGGGNNTVVLGPGNNTFIGGSTLVLGQLNTTAHWWGLLTSSVSVNNNMPQYKISMPALTLQGSGGYTPSAQLAALQSYNQYNSDNSWCDIGIRRQVPATATHPAVITTSWSINTSDPNAQFASYGPYYETYPSTPAGNSRDTIFAGSGNNLIIGSNGGNYIDAGSGDSQVFSGGGDDLIFGGSGNSLINAQGGNDYIVAGSGNHSIWGGAGDNTIYGGNGNNIIFAGIGASNWASIDAGVNFVNSGSGNTTIYGSGGNDTLVSGSKAGTGKTTTIYAGNGNETIFGGNGDDTIYGGAGSNTIYAGDGNTTIRLSRNANETSIVYGGNGNDTIYSGAGTNVLNGGGGSDTYVIEGGGGVVFITDNAGEGNKLVFGAGVDPASVTLSLGSLLIKTGNGNNAIHIQNFDPNNVQATPVIESFQFADGTTLSYTQLLERGFDIMGTAGDDVLNGTNTTDRISGDDGNDVLNGGAGNDVLMGGAGSDTYVYNTGDGADVISDSGYPSDRIGQPTFASAPNTLQLGAGIAADMVTPVWDGATLTLDLGGGDNIAIGSLSNLAIQDIAFSDGTVVSIDALLVQHGIVPASATDNGDVMATFGNGLPLLGGAGDDVLYGSPANDTLNGGSGNDELIADAGNDVLIGGAGDDTLIGGSGNDTYVFNLGDGSDVIIATAHPWPLPVSVDTVSFGAGITASMIRPGYDSATQTVSLMVGNNGDSINIGSMNDLAIQNVKFADGTTFVLDQLIAMNGGFNQIGSDGSDMLYGTSLADFLFGLAGDDNLIGDAGNDTLIGGQGNDYLNGGVGNDVYLFNHGNGADIIYDRPWRWGGASGEERVAEVNTLVLGENITPEMMVASVDLNGNTVLDFGSGDSVNVGWYSSNPNWDQSAIQEIRFFDGEVFTLNDVLNGSVLQHGLAAQVTRQDELFNFTVPQNPFFISNGSTYAYSAMLANGMALPSWLSFDSATGTFSGVASNWDVGSLEVTVIATDETGSGSSSSFQLNVLNVNDAPTAEMSLQNMAVEVGQEFSYSLPRATPPEGILTDATDTGTPDQVWPDYNKYLGGGAGNDSHVFARGDGNVYVWDWDETVGNVDTVQLVDVLPSDVRVSQNAWGDVTLAINGSADSLTMAEWLYSDASKIEQLIFADGTVWGVNEIQSRTSTVPSTGSDYITGTVRGDSIHALAGDDSIRAAAGDDTVLAGAGHDLIDGGGGSDILVGGSGSDDISGDWNYSDISNDFLDGGAGDDYVYGSISNDLLMGGTGEDEVAGDDGNDVVLFNRGDGNDWVYSWSENGVPLAQRSDTLSLGGGISYADLSFEVNGSDLTLNVGSGESICFENWFPWEENTAISTLQILAEAMPGYDPNSADPLLNKRIQQFDFLAMAKQFEAALAADPSITTWQFAPHLADSYLGGSDTAAIGGDMAYLYGKNGNLDGLSEAELCTQLNDASFGTASQTLIKVNPVPASAVFSDIDLIHGDSLAYSATLADGSPLPAWLTFDVVTQTFSGTPGNCDGGGLNISVIATDMGGLSATSNFMLTVAGGQINAAPVATDDAATLAEDNGTVTIAVADLLANDIDPDAGDALSMAGFDTFTENGNTVTQDANGNLVLDIGNQYQSLGAGQAANDSFSYTIADAAGATSSATVNVTITGTNDAPVVTTAIADQRTEEDTAFSYTLPADSFADTDHGDVLTYQAALADGSALPTWMTFDAATQTFSGTPFNENVGSLNVLVTATDTGGLSATSAFALDVANINDAPVAADDTVATNEDAATTSIEMAGLLANDHDIDVGDTFASTGFDAVSANGNAVTQDAAGNLVLDIGSRYQSLAAGQTATDSFSYTIADAAGSTSTATVNVTIDGVNDGPVAQDDSASLPEDATSAVIGNVLTNDRDVDQGSMLTVGDAGVFAGNYGNLTLNADGSYSYALDNALVQSLRAGQAVAETFAYQATDSIAAAQAALTVTVSGANDAPVVESPIADQQTNEDAPFSFAVPAGTFADIDNGDVLIYSATLTDPSTSSGQAPLPGWLTFDAATQTFSGTPDNWDVGNFSVTVTVTDTGGLSASSAFAVEVANINDAPTVSMALLDQGTLQDAAFSFNVPAGTFNDVDFIHGDTLTYGATLSDGTALPSWLTFDAATQTFSGTPDNWDVGLLNVQVTATDTGGLSASSAFNLNVINVNDTPTANADTGAAIEDGGAVLMSAATLLANDTDPDFIHGDALNIVGVSQAASGAAVSLMNGAVQYDPSTSSGQGAGTLFQSLAQSQTATDSFGYTVSDLAGATSTAQVTMTITGVNDAPVTVDDSAAVQEDVSVTATGNVLANDSDVDQGTVLSVANAGTQQGSYGNLVLGADGSYSYALDNPSTGSGQARAAVQGLMAGQTVTETFAYQATDGIAATPAMLTVTVTGSNDAPVAQDDMATVDEDSTLTIQSNTLLANDTDVDIGDTRTLVGVDAFSALGSSISLANGQVVYDHGGRFNSLMAGQTLTDSFGYAITDSAGAMSNAAVNVTVIGVNDGPQANGDMATMDEDTPWTTLTAVSLLANDTDPDTGDVLSIAEFDSITALGNTVSMDAAGNFVFDIGDRYQYLAQGEALTDTFNYTIADTAGETGTAIITMTIAGTNDALVAVADAAYVREDLNITPSTGSGQAPSNLDGTGNVLSNDSDVDQGTILSVADAGTHQGNYGNLNLAADGSYSYNTDNASLTVQSLGRDAQVVEHFGYTATDGIVGTASVLDVFLSGTNDAPILVAPLADQNLRSDKHFSWQMPAGSFIDIDQGDTLDYAATLADGTALPDWLSFDAATRTFSGEAPKKADFVDVQVTATDKVAATGSTVGSLSASDVFRISVSRGNEGVGNGEDAPPPGHDHNCNDGHGTSPGHPGGQGGNGYTADHAANSHGNESKNRSSDSKANKGDNHAKDNENEDSRHTDELIRTWFDEESTSERYASFSTLDRHGAWGGHIDRQVNRNVAKGISGDVSSEWERMNARLKKHLAQSGADDGIFTDFGAGSGSFGLFDSQSYSNAAQSGMGNGHQMKALAGLKEGLERLSC